MGLRLLLGLILTACVGTSDSKPDKSPTTPSTSSPATTTTSSTSTTSTPPPPTFDCSTVPSLGIIVADVPAAFGTNDVVFDTDGALIGSDGSVLWRATDPDTSDLYTGGIGVVHKMGILPDGDLVAARTAGDGGGILRIGPDGGSEVIAGSVQAYGLAVGSDGLVYVATDYQTGGGLILRIDPESGDITELIEAGANPPRDIAFGRDFTRLYFAAVDGGFIFGVDLDANLDPVGEPELVASMPESWHNTLEVDACGQLYFCGDKTIARVNVDGSISDIVEWNENNYGHGFDWGDPAGGWDEQAIYVARPYIGARVDEVFIGVPSAQWVGTVLGGTVH